jgi:hypothetical protein
MFKKTRLYFELMICDKYRGKNTGCKSVNGAEPSLLVPHGQSVPPFKNWSSGPDV